MKIKNKSKELTKPKEQHKKTVSIPGLKRPQTAYFLFLNKVREQNKNPEEKLNSRELGRMWKNLSDSAKKPYIDK